MDITSLMRKYMDECDDRSKTLTSAGIPGVLRESNELPLEAVEDSWKVIQKPERLARKFTFGSLQQRTLFMEYLLEAEEKSQHFAKIIIEGFDVTVEVYTHDIQRVTELDKEYAGTCDSIYDDVMLVRFTDYE